LAGGRPYHLAAGREAVQVVDPAEQVEVGHDAGRFPAGRRAATKLFLERLAVDQAGERIDFILLAEAPLLLNRSGSRAEPCQELAEDDRLSQEIVGSGGQRSDKFARAGLADQEQRVNVTVRSAFDRLTAELRQEPAIEVEQDHVGRLPLQGGRGEFRCSRFLHTVAERV